MNRERERQRGREGEDTGVHELDPRWQISIQFAESGIEYFSVKLFFSS